MKKSWRCRLGSHDWECLEAIHKAELRSNVIAELRGSRRRKVLPYSLSFVFKKVCIRPGCNKIVDQITPEKEKIKKEYFEQKERTEKAKEVELLHDPQKIEERIANKDW